MTARGRSAVRARAAQSLLLVLGLGLMTIAAGASLPVPGKVDARIRTAFYDPDQVYRLYGYVGYHIDLVFAADESFVGLSAGDPEALIYSAHGNVLTVRPKAASVHTNLTVTTSRHRYYFDYSASAREPEADDEVMYAVRFLYPANPVAKSGLTPAERVQMALTQAENARPENVDYWYCGDAAIKPIAASDNGVQTRLTFGARSELPAIFVLNDDGSESLLNFSIDAGDMIIQRVAARFILRRGKLTGCIVNKGYVGSGERLKSGTISPAVTRERRGGAP